ncbi:SurA N-terminal domain-containing protein [Georgenia sp. EYE_87]|uniref:SurA N-terminal domain-containing protein n=1 Tax=Georgenia sp. EYE_87 TaxID=2853448 RepID=UPI002002C20D|nr:SurA N-terminal domain-containing protein [Georgenia sp. EYE_87]MCK6211000.1 SurA N-terminal domain-containing protein [Georgenia sp. EYE_87]
MASTRPSHLIRTAVALAAAGLALAGCSAQPGTAATVNGTTISENEVDEATSEFIALTGQQDVTPVAVLNTLVEGELLDPIAIEAGYAVSDAEVEQFFLEQASAAGATQRPDVESEAFLDLGRYLLQYNEIYASPDAQAIFAEAETARQEADIEVNPRYAQTDDSGAFVPTVRDWIHQGEPAPTPAG